MSDPAVDWKKEVFEVLKEQDLSTMTKKKVRAILAEKLGEELVKNNKEKIKEYTTEFVESQQREDESKESDGGAAAEGGEEEEDDEEVPKKRKAPGSKGKSKPASKKAKKDEDEDEDEEEEEKEVDPRMAKARVDTANGKQPPKNLKKAQEGMMNKSQFMKNAERLELSVWGNKLSGPPRDFSSGNKGWWAGGKILVPVGKKKVWATIGVNVTIMGSKEWE
eukprot:gb/GEZN01009362.1/.p1 GENE.gb/GEZN01009362.1/~~gb/GEZN01009362.1/.p1  ORF type:complete len:221 (-),score=78.00 gb/GEZN01009362.1/:560-1222(-)